MGPTPIFFSPHMFSFFVFLMGHCFHILIQIIVPHGEPVTIDTFMAWRERFEAELALERAK